MKKYYLIYQIQNKLNGMIYVGKHMTDNKDDGYMGSGIRIRRAIEKYGLENFEKTILFECSSVEEMNAKEAEIVNEDFIARDDVYNIKLGGEGGWEFINAKDTRHQHALNSGKATKKTYAELKIRKQQNQLTIEDKQRIQRLSEASKTTWRNYSENEKISLGMKISKSLKEFYKTHANPMRGRQHSESSKQLMSEHSKGKNNFMFGKIWISNDLTHESKVISQDDPIPNGWSKGKYQSVQTDKDFDAKQQLINKILQLNSVKNISQHMSLSKLNKIYNTLLKQQQKKKQMIIELTKQYKFYAKFGWQKFVEKYKYTYTQANFVQKCKAYVKEFVPQIGKQRKMI